MNVATFEWLWEQARWEMDGGVNQHFHALQMATRAADGDAPEPVIFAALVHDLGKPLDPVRHDVAIAAALTRLDADTRLLVADHCLWVAYVRDGRRLPGPQTMTPRRARRIAFAEWDAASFDPQYPTSGLTRFGPLLEEFLTR